MKIQKKRHSSRPTLFHFKDRHEVRKECLNIGPTKSRFKPGVKSRFFISFRFKKKNISFWFSVSVLKDITFRFVSFMKNNVSFRLGIRNFF
jgi:hypothetical protein